MDDTSTEMAFRPPSLVLAGVASGTNGSISPGSTNRGGRALSPSFVQVGGSNRDKLLIPIGNTNLD